MIYCLLYLILVETILEIIDIFIISRIDMDVQTEKTYVTSKKKWTNFNLHP